MGPIGCRGAHQLCRSNGWLSELADAEVLERLLALNLERTELARVPQRFPGV